MSDATGEMSLPVLRKTNVVEAIRWVILCTVRRHGSITQTEVFKVYLPAFYDLSEAGITPQKIRQVVGKMADEGLITETDPQKGDRAIRFGPGPNFPKGGKIVAKNELQKKGGLGDGTNPLDALNGLKGTGGGTEDGARAEAQPESPQPEPPQPEPPQPQPPEVEAKEAAPVDSGEEERVEEKGHPVPEPEREPARATERRVTRIKNPDSAAGAAIWRMGLLSGDRAAPNYEAKSLAEKKFGKEINWFDRTWLKGLAEEDDPTEYGILMDALNDALAEIGEFTDREVAERLQKLWSSADRGQRDACFTDADRQECIELLNSLKGIGSIQELPPDFTQAVVQALEGQGVVPKQPGVGRREGRRKAVASVRVVAHTPPAPRPPVPKIEPEPSPPPEPPQPQDRAASELQQLKDEYAKLDAAGQIPKGLKFGPAALQRLAHDSHKLHTTTKSDFGRKADSARFDALQQALHTLLHLDDKQEVPVTAADLERAFRKQSKEAKRWQRILKRGSVPKDTVKDPQASLRYVEQCVENAGKVDPAVATAAGKWNEVVKLVPGDTPEDQQTKHIIDALTKLPAAEKQAADREKPAAGYEAIIAAANVPADAADKTQCVVSTLAMHKALQDAAGGNLTQDRITALLASEKNTTSLEQTLVGVAQSLGVAREELTADKAKLILTQAQASTPDVVQRELQRLHELEAAWCDAFQGSAIDVAGINRLRDEIQRPRRFEFLRSRSWGQIVAAVVVLGALVAGAWAASTGNLSFSSSVPLEKFEATE